MASNPITDGMNGIIKDQTPVANGQHEAYEDASSRDGSPYQSQNSNSESPTDTPNSDEQNARLAALVNNYGYRLIKENGQRKFCAPAEWNLPIPPRGSEVFVGKLPRDIYEDELVPLFERCGQIYEMRLMMDFSGTNRGYAFVTYTNREDARRACMELNNYEIRRGRHIGVVSSVDNCRLFVGGIPRTRTREDVKAEMSKLTEGVVDVILYPSAADKTKNRGFAFVEYESHRAAAKARRKLLPNRIQLWGSVIAVDWAEPEQEVDEQTMANVKVLYVRNLMVHTTEDTLRQAFERAAGNVGSVERVKKMRDFAFVHFATREQALRARDQLNGSELDGAIIEVVLSKPPYQSNIVRCMKNLQKSGGGRSQSVTSNGNDDYVAVAMRQMYAGAAPTLMNGILTSPTSTLASPPSSTMDPSTMNTPHQIFSMPQTPVAAAYTGFPCIDLYANTQSLLERQNSMANQMGNGNGMKYIGNAGLQTPVNGNSPVAGPRMNRGAAGMRSAGFQAMINNTLRHTAASRRKYSEQFLYDYLLNQQHQQVSLQQHQQLMAQQQAMVGPPGVVIIPNGPGLPFWRPAVTSPTSGYLPYIPTSPFAVPMPQTVPTSAPGPVPVVSEPDPVSVSVSVAVPVSAPAAITTVANSTEESPPPATQQVQQVAHNTMMLHSPQIFCFGNSGAVPFTSFQQSLADFCRDHGWGVPQYERMELAQKDTNGRDMTTYSYKITVPALVNTYGIFQCGKYCSNDMEAREAAAQYVLAQLTMVLTPTTPSMMGHGFDMFGMPMTPTSPWVIPDMANPFMAFNPLYQQQLRRPINQQLSVNAMTTSPPATV